MAYLATIFKDLFEFPEEPIGDFPVGFEVGESFIGPFLQWVNRKPLQAELRCERTFAGAVEPMGHGPRGDIQPCSDLGLCESRRFD